MKVFKADALKRYLYVWQENNIMKHLRFTACLLITFGLVSVHAEEVVSIWSKGAGAYLSVKGKTSLANSPSVGPTEKYVLKRGNVAAKDQVTIVDITMDSLRSSSRLPALSGSSTRVGDGYHCGECEVVDREGQEDPNYGAQQGAEECLLRVNLAP